MSRSFERNLERTGVFQVFKNWALILKIAIKRAHILALILVSWHPKKSAKNERERKAKKKSAQQVCSEVPVPVPKQTRNV